jgi:aminoglycoside/choline kinase family phosphotransferase
MSIPTIEAGHTPDPSSQVQWADAARQAQFEHWLHGLASGHGLHIPSLRVASADASFRRYFRIHTDRDTLIVVDAPPAHENCAAFVKVADLMLAAGLNVPQVLDWQREHGFMLLTDLGQHTWMQQLDASHPQQHLGDFGRAIDALIDWQSASQAQVLPPYDQALLMRELQLFPDWYVAQHRGLTLSDAERQTLDQAFATIVAHNLSVPQVYVHRDFMPRNLMLPADPQERRLGVLDFQDAVHGPITYDIASLMRDAFITWDEAFVLDVTVRYWERARQKGLLGTGELSTDFGLFWREVEWMGLQRHLKVAGIFARLGLRDHKPKYLADTPRFMAYIRATCSRYRELFPLLRLIDRIEGQSSASGYAFGRV